MILGKNMGKQPPKLLAYGLLLASWLLASTATAMPSTEAHSSLKPVFEPVIEPITKLTLEDAITLALSANYDILSAYNNRLAQRFAVLVAQDKFRPHVSAQVSSGRTWSKGSINVQPASQNNMFTVAPHAEILLPTGTWLAIDLLESGTKPPTLGDEPFAGSLSLTLMQPLLKNFGVQVNQASVRIALLQDRINRLNLRQTLIQTIYSVMLAYRTLMQATLLLDIANKAVQRSEELLEIYHEMVQAGRIAPAELIQVDSEIATRQLNAANAESAYIQAQASLLELLALGQNTNIGTVPETVPKIPMPSTIQAQAEAFRHRPEYYQGLLNVEMAQQQLLLAHNDRIWDLNFTAQHIRGNAQHNLAAGLAAPFPGPSHASFVGLTLSVPLLDVPLQQEIVNAEVALSQSRIGLEQVRNNMQVDVQTALRTLDLQQQIFELGQRASRLAEQKLANEREKLKAGRSSNFQVLRFVDDLVNAEISEIQATIAYLNAYSSLQVQMGSLLDAYENSLDDS